MVHQRFMALLGLLAAGGLLGAQDDEAVETPAFRAEQHEFYEQQVKPLLEQHCLRCHGGGSRVKGGLRLSSRDAVLVGGDSGPGVDLEHPEKSMLLRMMSHEDVDHQMPPQGKLDDAALEVFALWVREGLPFGEDGGMDAPADAAHEEEAPVGRDDGQAGWSYRPLRRPELPARRSDWIQNPIDAFTLDGMVAAGLEPAKPADRVALLRRLNFDLIGLPPTPAEIDAFLADERPDALARTADELLARPQYGEKWGRHWLDLVRYAETNGYERDSDKPHMWRYRDYVIRAFNEDKPYDRFVMEQLAGDELDDADHDAIIATGYHRLMQWDDEPGQGGLQARYDTLDDLLKVTTEGLLAMTVGCARCHDHKADPIPQEDYYRFLAYFHGVTPINLGGNQVAIHAPGELEKEQAFEADKKATEDRLSREILAIETEFQRRLQEHDDAPGAIVSDLTELRYRFYRDSFDTLPDFDQLRAEDEGVLEHRLLDLGPRTRDQQIGFVFEGSLLVPAEGEYRFGLDSDDGARLSVNGTPLIELEGGPLGREQQATLRLPRGTVPLRLDWFQAGGGLGLDVWWGPEQQQEWRHVFQSPGEAWTAPDFDDSAWRSAPGGFGREGTPGAQIGTEWTGSDVWLRRDFEWSADRGRDAMLVAHHDEDLEVFVNGVLALRRSGFRRDYGTFAMSEEARAALREGRNSLAVHCRNTGGGQFVDVAVIPAARVGSLPAHRLAQGRFPLSVGEAGTVDLARQIESHVEILSEDERRRYRRLVKEREQSRQRRFPRRMATAVQEGGRQPAPLHVHVRGNANTRGAPVEPGVPQALGRAAPIVRELPEEMPSSGRRRALAEWMVQPDHPLTSRVMVNRIWHHHFGRGLVRSTSDFGELGERPTHPELLDWLACEFVEQGWSIKAMHRLILSSATYQQSSRPSERARQIDPANDHLSHFDLRRLTAEELRDSVLAVNGRLNPKMGGPSFYAPMPEEALATSSRPDAAWGRSSPEDVVRRSVYIKVKRSLALPLLASLDAADTDMACPERFTTTQPTQALILLNGEFMNEEARHFAQRLREEAGEDPRDRVSHALRLAFGRRPADVELESHLSLWRELQDEAGLDAEEALDRLALVLLNLNEFIYVD